MPVSTTDNQTQVTLTGAGQTIPVNFPFWDSSDLVVRHLADGATATTLYVEGSNYTVTGGDGAGGTVVMTAGSADDVVTVYRETPFTQTLDLEENDPLPSSSLETALDKLCVQIQQVKSQIGFCLRLSEASEQPDAVELITAADSILGFDGSGDLAAIDSSQLQTLLNLPETVVDSPMKTFGNHATAVPDFTGQLGVETDLLALADIRDAIHIAYGTSTGEWRRFTSDIADEATHSGVAGTDLLLVDDGGNNASATISDVVALASTADDGSVIIGNQVFS